MALTTDGYEDIPDDIYLFLQPSRFSIHPPGFLPWAHPVQTVFHPHSHTILEDLNVEAKNAIADHIETYHKNRRNDASE